MFSSKTGTTESSAKDLDRVRLAKQKKPKKTKEKTVRKVARTVQDTIPYEHVHGKYIFEVEKNRYSVTYSFSDVTYDAADAAEQERIFLAYGDLLNSFDTSDDIQITLHNNVINQKGHPYCPINHTKLTVKLYTVKDYYNEDYPEIYDFTDNEKARYQASKAIIQSMLDYWEGGIN